MRSHRGSRAREIYLARTTAVVLGTHPCFCRFVLLSFVGVAGRCVAGAGSLEIGPEGRPFVRPGSCLGRSPNLYFRQVPDILTARVPTQGFQGYAETSADLGASAANAAEGACLSSFGAKSRV